MGVAVAQLSCANAAPMKRAAVVRLVVDKRAKRRFVISKSVWERPERTESRPGAQSSCATIRSVEGPDDWKSSPAVTVGDTARRRLHVTRMSEFGPHCFVRIRARMCDPPSRDLRADLVSRGHMLRTCEWNSRAVPLRYKIALPFVRDAGRIVRRQAMGVGRRGREHRARPDGSGRRSCERRPRLKAGRPERTRASRSGRLPRS